MKKSSITIIVGILITGTIIGFFLTVNPNNQSYMVGGPSKSVYRHGEPVEFSFTISHAKDNCSIPNYEIFYEDEPEPIIYRSYMTPICSEYPFFFKPAKTWKFPLEGDTISFDKNGTYRLVITYHGEGITTTFTVTNLPNLLEETSSNEMPSIIDVNE
jgi:hypothetical protein